ETFGIKRYGTAEKIKAATPALLYKTMQRLLKTAAFEIMYIGDSSPDKAQEVFKNAFEKIERQPEKITVSNVRNASKIKRVSEEMELSQSKLVMGFRTDCAEPDPEVNSVRLMSAILGGTANSKLFCNVREKQSLCYYCASRYDRLKGILIVDSGVEGDNIEKAEQGIIKEIEDMKNGVISDFELESAKLAIVNSFLSTNDTVGGIEAWYTNQLFDESFKTIEEVTQRINAVTKDEVIAAAKKLTLDTVYALKNK
ncbi:MAG: insulinase family protein, partial [Ruminococcus sp.]|nr:insulinase family protein [Ruminococcus sp.]